jgi:hypothetical protein
MSELLSDSAEKLSSASLSPNAEKSASAFLSCPFHPSVEQFGVHVWFCQSVAQLGEVKAFQSESSQENGIFSMNRELRRQ